MEEFTKDQKQYAYKRLGEREKEFISSDALTEVYQQIGTRNGFLLDMTGKMSNVVFLALIGLVKSTEVRGRLQNALGVSGQRLDSLLNELNEKVFVPYRKFVAGEEVELSIETAPMTKPEENTPIDRDALLAEIENPTPAAQPVTVNIGGPAMPREMVPQPAQTKESVANEFIAGKLSETVNLPAQRTAIPPEPTLKNPEPEKPKPRYTVDPYRESIN